MSFNRRDPFFLFLTHKKLLVLFLLSVFSPVFSFSLCVQNMDATSFYLGNNSTSVHVRKMNEGFTNITVDGFNDGTKPVKRKTI